MADPNEPRQVAFMDDIADKLDRMTLAERLRNPSMAPTEIGVQLEMEPTRRDMDLAASVADAASELAEHVRSRPHKHITEVKLIEAVDAATRR